MEVTSKVFFEFFFFFFFFPYLLFFLLVSSFNVHPPFSHKALASIFRIIRDMWLHSHVQGDLHWRSASLINPSPSTTYIHTARNLALKDIHSPDLSSLFLD
jgi:hypothetical protein